MKSAKHLTIVIAKLLLVLILTCIFLFSFAQKNEVAAVPVFEEVHAVPSAPGWLILKNIVITGNKKTKDYIIKREMGIVAGDSILITNLPYKLEKIRQYIYNTTLFVTVKVEPILINAFECDIIVTVKERLYVFPIPQFQLADRSFDEWLAKYNGSLSRVNYGIKFVHYNLSGRKDQLRLFLINGYTRNVSASYNAPYSNARLTNGFYIEGGFSQAKEIAYKTNYDNSIAFFNNGRFVRNYWYINGGYTIRRAIKKKEIISLGYSHMKVFDSIINHNFNPGYFNYNSTKKGFVDLTYTIQYQDVNNILYPLEGITGFISFQKRGLSLKGNINMFSIEGQYNQYNALGKGWYSSMQFGGKLKLPFKQPFINQNALGDKNNFLRGLDYYTIDGAAFSTAKFNIKKEILNFTIPTFVKSKPYNKIPFRIFAKVFSDFGYVYAKENQVTRLNNKLLTTAGFGLDVVTFYDINIRLDYSLNQLGEKRLAVDNRSGF